MKNDLKSMHQRGMQFLKPRRAILPEKTTGWSDLAKISKDAAARKLRDELAERFQMDQRDYLRDVQFAAAVETIIENCGPCVREVLFDVERPQLCKSIMQLSRTADTRQRYRVEGVRAGRFRSVAPQNDDLVYDTVAFCEVLSRLRRGRGAIRALQGILIDGVDQGVREESRRLVELCREVALVLQQFVGNLLQEPVVVPPELKKDVLLAAIKHAVVGGKVVGLGRQTLRLTIKSVWDFPEMRGRRIFPTEVERQEAIRETDEIIAIADEILLD